MCAQALMLKTAPNPRTTGKDEAIPNARSQALDFNASATVPARGQVRE